ncbi:unnamed protein product [Didymodactylos carnosus]|uniref:Uncharacterized protein n=1 Tax=Didymodactylos carnosus TaxID=1234261 RepID=A0A813V471_9BILA|nr:unnamed protein product [Didymodactylos carnosus]CAF3619512.1 unnamed protein product [Didymodactylos carnosus]
MACTLILRDLSIERSTNHITKSDYKKLTVAGPVSSMVFMFEKTWLACAIGNRIFIYKIDEGRHISTLSAHIRQINVLLYDDDKGCLISGGEDGLVYRWDIEGIKLDRNIESQPAKSYQGHTQAINDLSVIKLAKSHLLLTASNDSSVRLWDIVSGKCICTLLCPSEVHSICSAELSRTIFCGLSNGNIHAISLSQLTTLQHQSQNSSITIDQTNSRIFNHHSGIVNCLQLSDHEQILYSGGKDKNFAIWDVPSGQIRFKTQNHGAISNVFLTKIDLSDESSTKNICLPFNTLSNDSTGETSEYMLSNGTDDSIQLVAMPGTTTDYEELAMRHNIISPVYHQMATMLLNQQMNT